MRVFLQAASLSVVILVLTQPALSADYMVIGNVLHVEGEIKEGEFERFKKCIERSPRKIDVISLEQSPGGNLTEAIAIGRWIREQKLNTLARPSSSTYQSTSQSISAIASAAAIVFLGGVSRSVDLGKAKKDRAVLGFHPIRFVPKKVVLDYGGPGEESQVLVQIAAFELNTYIAEMIGDAYARELLRLVMDNAKKNISKARAGRDQFYDTGSAGFKITWLGVPVLKALNIVNFDPGGKREKPEEPKEE